MLVFSISDKGGTGRSVTSCNLAFRLALDGKNVAYLDFDFGSPTAGALFEISSANRGVTNREGLHSYLLGNIASPTRLDVRTNTDRAALRTAQARAGRLVLLPGDEGGAEFLSADEQMVERCARLLMELEQEFRVTIVDLSSGRSAAVEIVLRATAQQLLSRSTVRWLVFHRWTRQHILAAHGLVHGSHGLIEMGRDCTHDPARLLESIRYVRTAVPPANSQATAERPAQAAWLQEQNTALKKLATGYRLGSANLLGATPMEPVLQWREQVILDADVAANIANEATTAAFAQLARRLDDVGVWEGN